MTGPAAGGLRSHPGPDEDDVFVHAAVRSFATGSPCPLPPGGTGWVERARTAGVLSPVLAQLTRSGGEVPPPLAHVRASVVGRHLRTLADLDTVGAALDAAGVPWAVLKGPVLTSVVFERADVRDYTDLDVLVAPTLVRAAIEVLTAAGADVLPVDWPHVNRARTAELALRLPHGTVLDLHWDLVNLGAPRDGYALPIDELLARRVERRVGSATLPTLDDLDLVLHVLLHACLSGGHTLRWLLDAQQCTRWLSVTPEQLAQRAAELRVTAPARAVLDSVATHLDGEVAPWADALGDPSAWTRVLTAVSRRRPPSYPSLGPRTSQRWYAATRPTGPVTLRAVARTAVRAVRHARSGWPEPAPTPFDRTDPGFERWLRIAEASVGQRR